MIRLHQMVERLLVKGGFIHPEVRIVMRNQIYVSLGFSLVMMLVTMVSLWSFAFFAGAIIASVNFWALARIVQELVYVQKGAPALLFFIFMGKMILSGLALYWLIGILYVPVWGLVAGLSTVVINITMSNIAQMRRK